MLCTDTFCPSILHWFETKYRWTECTSGWKAQYLVRLDFHESETCRASSALQSFILPISRIPNIWPICDQDYQTFEFKNWCVCQFFFSGMHTVECSFGVRVVVGVQVWKAVLIFGLCCEELALISSSPSWPTMKRFDENALKLRVDGMWHLPHQTKINTGRGHFPSFRELTFINITCVSCCGHKVLETSRWWE